MKNILFIPFKVKLTTDSDKVKRFDGVIGGDDVIKHLTTVIFTVCAVREERYTSREQALLIADSVHPFWEYLSNIISINDEKESAE